jgi:hypothetical protein
MSCHEFGYELPECYIYQKTIEKGFNDLLLDDHLRHEFLKAVSEQPDGLGIDNGELAERIIESIEHAFEEEEDENALFILLKAYNFLPWFQKTSEFKEKSPVLASRAYDRYNTDFLFEILKMNQGAACVEQRGEFEDHGDGHAEVSVTFIAMLNKYEVDRWKVHYIGWYWDIDTMEWHVERHNSSESPDDRTLIILEVLGYSNFEMFEMSEVEPREPGYSEPDGKGNWAVFLDDDLWGQYKREDSAKQTYDAMMDAEDFSGHTSGRDITLRYRSGSDEEWEEV